MTTFRCRSLKPSKGPWYEVEAETAGEAAQALHMGEGSLPAHKGYVYRDVNFAGPDTLRFVIFLFVEVEGEPKPIISRVFETGIYRRGSIKSGRDLTLEDLAKHLDWGKDPKALLDEGWVGEVSDEEAHRRVWEGIRRS